VSIWRQPNGKIYRNGSCNVVNCDASPCEELVVTTCCPDGIPENLTLSWTAEFGGLPPASVGSGGSIPLVWDGATAWTWTGEPASFGASQCAAGQFATVSMACVGTDFVVTVTDVLAVELDYTFTATSCSPFLGEIPDSDFFTFGCGSYSLLGVTITE
jgi:hypothetical protein